MIRAITESIYYVGVNDFETDLFEAIWPLPQGVSYNTYLIKDEKIALIDTVKKNYIPEYIKNIQNVIADKPIDYLVINHMEPDHSGAVGCLLKLYPHMQMVGNAKTAEYLKDFYQVDESRIKIINDQESLSLGKRTLQFFLVPMVHWPETMVTYERSSQILFSGDAFGGFGALQGGIFDDEVDLAASIDEIRRYFSNIVGKYTAMVLKAIDKLNDIPIRIIAATHGPIFRKDPQFIINLYRQWSHYQTEKGAVIVYASMYDNTKKMAEVVARGLAEDGVDCIKFYNISHTHISFIINEIWKYKALILGSCTYNGKLFPPMEMLISFLNNYTIKQHLLGIFGSYTWSGGALSALKDFSVKGQWQLIEPVIEAKCSPNAEVLNQCLHLGKNIGQNLKQQI